VMFWVEVVVNRYFRRLAKESFLSGRLGVREIRRSRVVYVGLHFISKGFCHRLMSYSGFIVRGLRKVEGESMVFDAAFMDPSTCLSSM
jgi:hypothetical protein